MAVLKSSELKYGTPMRFALGDLFLTVTQVETPASAELQAETESLELDKTKLGLTVPAVAGLDPAAAAEGVAPLVGSTATTTALPVAAWTTPLKKAKVANETKVLATGVFLTDVQIVAGKLVVRVYGLPVTALADGNPVGIEPKDASKAAVGGAVFTVFVLGK